MMITLKPEEYDKVKFLLNQSLRGIHLAFDPEDIKPLLSRREIFSPIINTDELDVLEGEIKAFFMIPDISRKRAYFKRLDEKRKVSLLKTYFNVVENMGFEQSPVTH